MAFLLSAWCCALTMQVHSQESGKSGSAFFVDISLGAGHHRVQDAGMSPLRYGGKAANVLLGFRHESEKFMQLFNVSGGASRPGNNFDFSPSVLTSLHYDIDYAFIWRTKAKPLQTQLFVGGAVNHTNHLYEHNRYGNNSLNYAGTLGLHLSAALTKEFNVLGLPFAAFYRLDIPVMSRFWRPFYATSIPREHLDLDSDPTPTTLWNSGDFALPNEAFRLKSTLEIHYLMKNGNRVKLGYLWDYNRIEGLHRVQTRISHISLGLLFNFRKHENS